MYVCMYVCMYVWMYVCMYVYTYIYIYIDHLVIQSNGLAEIQIMIIIVWLFRQKDGEGNVVQIFTDP